MNEFDNDPERDYGRSMTNSEAWSIVASVLSRRVMTDNDDECKAVEIVSDERDAFIRREVLVQEVIAAHHACSALASPWSPSEHAQRRRQEAGLRLKAALDTLAGWQP